MKNVILLGDSIRLGAPPHSPGYGVYVKELLADRANVFAPNANCGFALLTLRFLFDWSREWATQMDAKDVRVIHWNNGLWDVLRMHGEAPFSSVEEYVKALERIYRMLQKLYPNAKVIFATTTSTIEEGQLAEFRMLNADVEAYNQAAIESMTALGLEINDLHAISLSF